MATSSVSPADRSAFRRVINVRPSRGFTLFETIVVLSVLALVAAGIMTMLPHLFRAQDSAREHVVGMELMRACGERLLSGRLTGGMTAVNVTSCSDFTQLLDGFNNPPSISLVSTVAGTDIACSIAPCSCSGNASRCLATVSLTKPAGEVVSWQPLVIEFSAY